MVPYLNFPGSCAEAFRFYAEVFGGEIRAMMTYGETPAAEHMPPEFRDKVVFAHLVADGRELMASDSGPPMFRPAQGMSVSVHPASAEEARRLFEALSAGGSVTMPFEATFWSSGFGACVDRFGTPWMINGPAPAGAGECG